MGVYLIMFYFNNDISEVDEFIETLWRDICDEKNTGKKSCDMIVGLDTLIKNIKYAALDTYNTENKNYGFIFDEINSKRDARYWLNSEVHSGLKAFIFALNSTYNILSKSTYGELQEIERLDVENLKVRILETLAVISDNSERTYKEKRRNWATKGGKTRGEELRGNADFRHQKIISQANRMLSEGYSRSSLASILSNRCDISLTSRQIRTILKKYGL